MDLQFFVQFIRYWKYICPVLLVLWAVVVILRHVVSRQYHIGTSPTKPMRWINVWGTVYDYMSTSKFNHLCSTVYMLQVGMGLNLLFKNQKLFYIWLSYIPVIIITKAETLEDLMSKHLKKAWLYDWIHPWLGTGLLTSHGTKWKTRRKLLTSSFHFDILKDFLPVFNEQSQLLVHILKEEAEKPFVDIAKLVTLCSLDIVCETILGVSINAQKNSESEYVKAVARAAEILMLRITHPKYYFEWSFRLTKNGRQFHKCLKILHSFTEDIIAQKKKKLSNQSYKASMKRRALMDLLLEQHLQDQTLTDQDIREEIDTFAFEGHDTTSSGMSWALYLIGLHKDVQDNLEEELNKIFGDDRERSITTDDLNSMHYLERVLKESQRIYPSVPFFGREITEDTTLDGHKVRKGSSVLVITYLLHRDETVFPNPEKFDPDRFLPENSVNRHPFAYLPFSAGPRNCIGQRFAMMEEKVVIANILRNFTLESLDPRDKVLVAVEVVLKPAQPLRIKLTPRTTV